MGLFDRLRKGRMQPTGNSDVDKLIALLESSDLPGRRAIVNRFHISEHDFNKLYVSYHFSLLMSGETSGWNDDVDDFAREIGALSEQEIGAAKTALHHAVLNRIKLRLVTEGGPPVSDAVPSAKTRREKAQILVQVANLSAISSYTKMAENFPELSRLKNIHNWDFFVTGAIVASAVFHMQMALDRDQEESIQLDIAEELIRVHPQAWDAISDLVKFIDRAKKPAVPSGEVTDPKVARVLNQIHEQMGASIGSWVVWNLRGNAPVDSDLPLLSAIGRFCYEGIGEELSAEFIGKDA